MTGCKKTSAEEKDEWHLVEVYGSLLNSEQRQEILDEGGTIEEVGDIKRSGWKLSFDKRSRTWKEAVSNLVETGNNQDVYYTKVYKVDKKAFNAIMDREMGQESAEKWRQKKPIDSDSYRPVKMPSEFGDTTIFLIPEEGRQPTPTNTEAKYVNTVRKGIPESFKEEKQETNLGALERAILESKQEARRVSS